MVADLTELGEMDDLIVHFDLLSWLVLRLSSLLVVVPALHFFASHELLLQLSPCVNTYSCVKESAAEDSKYPRICHLVVSKVDSYVLRHCFYESNVLPLFLHVILFFKVD